MSDPTMILPRKTAQKLADLEAGLHRFERKYGMSFDAYHHLWENEDRPEHYSFEAEDDYLMWEGLVTRRNRLVGNIARMP